MCERFCGCWGDKLYLLGRATFPSSPPSAREWRNTRRTPPSREEPGSQEVSLGGEQVEPGSKPPQSPTVAPKDVESDFITPRKRGKRRLSSDSSNSEGESLDSRTPLKMTRVGEDVMADLLCLRSSRSKHNASTINYYLLVCFSTLRPKILTILMCYFYDVLLGPVVCVREGVNLL